MYTPGSLFDGRYILKERKGRGSFGEVWLATDNEVGVDFAIKIYVAMDTKGLEEFKKEYQLSCNLINSNLLHVNRMEISQTDSCPYLVMPYCPQGASTLAGNVTEMTMWHFLHDVANGLSYLHEQNPPIIHQDIKPDNILQTQSGNFVITDFGISKQIRATLHATNNSSGAIAYMGPERFGRDYHTIKASDIWSLGATLFEMATGQLPFEGRGGAMMNAGAEIPDLPRNFSAKLNDTVRSCMAKDPWDRPSAAQLVDLADDAIKGRLDLSMTEETTQVEVNNIPASTLKKKYPSVIVACGVISIVLIAGILTMLFCQKNSDSKFPNSPNTLQQTTSVVVEHPNTASQAHSNNTENRAEKSVSPARIEAGNNTPVKVQDPTKAQEPVKTQTDAKQSSAKTTNKASNNGTLNLGYATWHGGIKNGKPDGKGTLKFTKDYELQGHAVKAGDTITGECSNGRLSGFCKWQGQNGTKSILLGE